MDEQLTPAEFAQLRRLKPAEAMQWMQERSHAALTFAWEDLLHEEHSRHFTVSRLARLDLLQSLHGMLIKSVNGDLSRRDWQADAEKLLADAGWWGEKEVLDPATGKMVKTTFNPQRLGLILDVNTRQAAAVGQWARIQRSKRTHPYLRYITKRDERVRELHAGWDNVTLPVDDPFWKTHYPPNGWRCRCRVVPVSQREYDAGVTPTGAPMVKQRPEVVDVRVLNRRTGEISTVPAGIDPGFDFNPGLRSRQTLQALIQQKQQAAIPALAKAAEMDGLTVESAAATYAEQARLDKPNKMPPLPLSPVFGHAIQSAQAAGVNVSGKMVGLDHDGVLHALDHHGKAREALRGQVPITTADLAVFPKIFNAATLRAGNPAVARDGSKFLEGDVVLGAFKYSFVARVRRHMVTVQTLYKRKA